MGIKLKNKKLRFITLIVTLYIFSVSLFSIVDVYKNSSYIYNDPMTNYTFSNQFYNYIEKVTLLYTEFKDYAIMKPDEKVTESELNVIEEKYKTKYNETLRALEQEYQNRMTYNNEILKDDKVKSLISEKNKKINDLKKKYSILFKSIKADAIKVKDASYVDILNFVNGKKSLRYYITNKDTNESYSNLSKGVNINKYIKEETLYYIKFPVAEDKYQYYSSFNSLFKQNNLEAYFVIPKKLIGYEQIYDDFKYYISIRERLVLEIILGVISFLIGGVLAFFWLKDKGDKLPYNKKIIGKYNQIPLDVRTLIFVIYSSSTLFIMNKVSFFYKPIGINHLIKLTYVAAYIFYLFANFALVWFYSKNSGVFKQDLENTFLKRLAVIVKESFIIKSTLFKVVALYALTIVFAICMIGSVELNSDSAVLICLAYCFMYLLIVPLYTLKKIAYINVIIKGSSEISSGNLGYSIKEEGNSFLMKLARNINNMGKGYKEALGSQIKSERLKAELITNVSHDLKTPLTSIINYIDLLKKPDLSNEELEGYIGVLDRKSHRLKVLIEDLFEASKITSGDVELFKERIDIVALINQIIGEYDEKIKSAALSFRLKSSNSKVYHELDSKKSWRAFDNLINNIIKYSQSKTRVFIDISEEKDKTLIIMKNISAYEMNFNEDEIFERFKRGDKSRNTEGSGLGLAIAKSIIELQGGRLTISIDGDLFKVTIEF